MARLKVRGRDTREFEIHESALPFWQGVEVLERIPDIGDEPAEVAVAESAPAESEESKTGSRAAKSPKSIAAE